VNEISSIRSQVYKILPHLFCYPEKPDISGATVLTNQNEMEDFKALGDTSVVPGIVDLLALLEKAKLEDLQVEYCGLFDYRPKCPPYEGAHRDIPKRNLIMVDLVRLYDKEGIVCPSTFPDHISAELAFMHFLSFNEASSSGNNPEKMAAILHTEKEFMDEHLLKWVPDFCDCLNKNAELPFFTSLAMLTKEFILQDAEYIDSLLGEL